jgi:hypothetical protein
VQTERLRPDGVPPALGGTFFLAGYRVFARFRTADGRTLRGLRILRSDTDRTLMALGGNLLTHYNYHRCRASVVTAGDAIRFTIHTPGRRGRPRRHRRSEAAATRRLPAGSPFASVREARRSPVPLPFTFDYEDETARHRRDRGAAHELAPAPVPSHVTGSLLRSAALSRAGPRWRRRSTCATSTTAGSAECVMRFEQIVRFNWPFYAVAALVTAAAPFVMLRCPAVVGPRAGVHRVRHGRDVARRLARRRSWIVYDRSR